MNLETAVTLFLDDQIPSTRRSYLYVLRAMVEFIGPSRPLDLVRPDDLMLYMQQVRARPSVKSAATINKHSRTIRTFFNFCVKSGLLEKSPANGP